MHPFAAAALLAATRGTTTALLVSTEPAARGLVSLPELQGRPDPGYFIHTEGFSFRGVLLPEGTFLLIDCGPELGIDEANLTLPCEALLRDDGKALVIHLPDEGCKPWRVLAITSDQFPRELSQHFDRSVALWAAARIADA